MHLEQNGSYEKNNTGLSKNDLLFKAFEYYEDKIMKKYGWKKGLFTSIYNSLNLEVTINLLSKNH